MMWLLYLRNNRHIAVVTISLCQPETMILWCYENIIALSIRIHISLLTRKSSSQYNWFFALHILLPLRERPVGKWLSNLSQNWFTIDSPQATHTKHDGWYPIPSNIKVDSYATGCRHFPQPVMEGNHTSMYVCWSHKGYVVSNFPSSKNWLTK